MSRRTGALDRRTSRQHQVTPGSSESERHRDIHRDRETLRESETESERVREKERG